MHTNVSLPVKAIQARRLTHRQLISLFRAKNMRRMIISGTSISLQNLKKIVTIQSRIFLLPPRIRKCAQSDWASQYFLGLPSPHSQAPGPIFTINTSNDVAPHKGPEKKIFYI